MLNKSTPPAPHPSPHPPRVSRLPPSPLPPPPPPHHPPPPRSCGPTRWARSPAPPAHLTHHPHRQTLQQIIMLCIITIINI